MRDPHLTFCAAINVAVHILLVVTIFTMGWAFL